MPPSGDVQLGVRSYLVADEGNATGRHDGDDCPQARPGIARKLGVVAQAQSAPARHGPLCRSGGALAGAEVSAVGEPAWYEIRVAGVLDSRWAAWFDGLQISGQGEETVICGMVADQPALHGLLAKIRDLGLCLISVRRLDTGQVRSEPL